MPATRMFPVGAGHARDPNVPPQERAMPATPTSPSQERAMPAT